MPVHIFLGRNLAGRVSDPVFHQEPDGLQRICSYLWDHFHHLEKTYAIVASVQCTATGREVSPDLIVISELGLGVVELKHHYGEINCNNRDGAWYANGVEITVPNTNNDPVHYSNPFQQVVSYANQIASDLRSGFPAHWLPGSIEDWSGLRLHAAVCFTNILADLRGCKQKIDPIYRRKGDQVVFDIVSPAEMPRWTVDLRFEKNLGHSNYYDPYKLSQADIIHLAEDFFMGVPYDEMITVMRQARPALAHLMLIEANRRKQQFTIDQDEVLIGRHPDVCTIIIPDYYSRVSRRHARIIRTAQGFVINDEGSRNGTYVNGVRVRSTVLVRGGEQVLTLGAPQAVGGACELRFLPESTEDFGSTTTS